MGKELFEQSKNPKKTKVEKKFMGKNPIVSCAEDVQNVVNRKLEESTAFQRMNRSHKSVFRWAFGLTSLGFFLLKIIDEPTGIIDKIFSGAGDFNLFIDVIGWLGFFAGAIWFTHVMLKCLNIQINLNPFGDKDPNTHTKINLWFGGKRIDDY